MPHICRLEHSPGDTYAAEVTFPPSKIPFFVDKTLPVSLTSLLQGIAYPPEYVEQNKQCINQYPSPRWITPTRPLQILILRIEPSPKRTWNLARCVLLVSTQA